MKKRILSVFLTVAMLLTSVVFAVPAVSAEGDVSAARTTPTPAAATGTWADFAATAFDGDVAYGTEGYGTAENPYKIATPEQLAYLAKLANEYTDEGESKSFEGEYFVLTQDIDLAGHYWNPISATYTSNIGYKFEGLSKALKVQMTFKGVFDGQDHSVTGLTFGDGMLVSNKVPATIAGFGLFGTIGGTVKNLNVEGVAVFTNLASFNATLFKNGCVAILASTATGAAIENVNANVLVDVTTAKAEIQVAGFIGYATDSTIIRNCTLSGSVKCTNSGISLAGGFVATVEKGAEFYSCSNYADVSAVTTKSATIVIAGGFVGKTHSANPASKLEMGAGQNLTGLANCTNYGKVSAEGDSCQARVGSLIGNAGRTSGKGDYYIESCINHGLVSANYYNSASKKAGISALVGLQESGAGMILKSFSSVYAVCTDETTAVALQNGLVKVIANKNLNDVLISAEGYYVPSETLFLTPEAGIITAVDGASLRLNPTKASLATLRFDCNISTEALAILSNSKIVVGTILIRADLYLAAAEGADSFDEILANLDRDQYRNIKASYDENGNFSALYANISASDYTTDFVAIPYLTIILNEKTGDSYTTYDVFTADDDARTVNVAGIAQKYIDTQVDDAASPYYFTGEQLAILESYLQ